MNRAVAGYAYIIKFYPSGVGCVGKVHHAFKLDGYIYIKPSILGKQVFYRYHEDSTNDLVAFQPCKAYNVNPPF